MDYNYHTHTFRCNHATGTPEEYVLNAISSGIKYLGFSEHIPYEFAEERYNKYRLHVAETSDYVDEIKKLRIKYRELIEIWVGFEMEYYPDKFSRMLDFAKRNGAEYLILGQHFMNGIYTGGSHVVSGTDSEKKLQDYVSDTVCAMKTGVFSYVAHPDMFNFFGDEKVYENEMRNICVASKEMNIPLEVNCQGITNNRPYPTGRFWRIAGDVGCPVTIGIDAHSAEAICDSEVLAKAKSIVSEYELNYIGRPDLVKI